MADPVLHVVCYDIGNDRLRRRIQSDLETRGVWVQGSVFEIWMTPAQARRLGDRLGALLPHSDSLRIYPVSRRSRAKAQSCGRGLAPDFDGPLIF